MPHPTDIHVGQKLREARAIKSMSQDQLSKILGISFQQVQKYEKGNNRIGASRLWQIAEALDMPISYFFEGLKDMDNQADQGSVPNRTIDLARRIESIPDENLRQQILGLIRVCAK